MKNLRVSMKTFVAAICLIIASQKSNAQYDAMFTQYMFNETFINPAYAGSKEAMSASMVHRQQWVNFPGRPVTTSFSLHGPIMGNKMGAGLSILNDRIGVLNRNLIYASYAYRLTIDEKSTLAMGLMGGIDNQVNKFSDLKITNNIGATTDNQFSQNSASATAPNFGVGLYYNTKTLYAGISIPRLIQNDISFSNNTGATIKTARLEASRFTYYLTAGYLFKLTDEFKLRANTMIKLVKNAPAQIDLGANLLIKDLVWVGSSYRSKSALSALLGIQANKQLLVCYSYDYTVNKIQTYSRGSHEIALNYLFSFKSTKVITPRYF